MAPSAVGLSVGGAMGSANSVDGDLPLALGPSFAVPVLALGDAHAALMGEAWRGGLRGATRAAMLSLGSRLGGAFMTEGRLEAGAHQLAGHWGRTRVLHAGRFVALDDLVSATGLARLHRDLGGAAQSAREVLAGLRQGAHAREALQQWLEQLALLVHNLHWSLDPGLLLLGGEMLETREHWWPQLESLLVDLPLVVRPAELGAQSGLIGAAKHALNALAAEQAVIDPRGLI